MPEDIDQQGTHQKYSFGNSILIGIKTGLVDILLKRADIKGYKSKNHLHARDWDGKKRVGICGLKPCFWTFLASNKKGRLQSNRPFIV